MSDQLISQAAELIRAGKNTEARQILMRVIKENPRNEPAWLWLVQTLPTDAMRISALEQCLKYFPQSERARLGLEHLTARQSRLETPAGSTDQLPAAGLPEEAGPSQQAPVALPPTPRLSEQETAMAEPLGSAQEPLHSAAEPLEPATVPPTPDPLDRFQSGEGEKPVAEQSDALSAAAAGSTQPFLDADVEPAPSSIETSPEEIQELRAAGVNERSKLTVRSSLRAVLIVFYAVVLIGGGYVVWQRYGSDITAWFKGLPQMVIGAVSPAKTPTPQATLTSTVSPVVIEDNGSSPRNGLGEILFISEREGSSDLFIDRLNGRGPDLVIPAGSPSTQITDPAWSVDGLQIAFIRGEGQKTDLFTSSPDGSGLVVQTNDHAGNAHPSWAPDGNRIVFVSQRDGGQDLYVLTLSTGEIKRLTEKSGKNDAPAWSPDGSRIAFVSDREGFLGLYLIDPDGGDPVLLSSSTQSVSSPAWSPDSQKIAFASDTKTDRLLYVVSRDGAAADRITFSPGVDDHPSWSPDGAWIVFTSERRKVGQPTLFVVRANGKGLAQFDTETHLDRSPVWSLVIKK